MLDYGKLAAFLNSAKVLTVKRTFTEAELQNTALTNDQLERYARQLLATDLGWKIFDSDAHMDFYSLKGDGNTTATMSVGLITDISNLRLILESEKND